MGVTSGCVYEVTATPPAGFLPVFFGWRYFPAMANYSNGQRNQLQSWFFLP